MWEEPCISGKEGSGTVFFSGCPLGCVYCQNHNIGMGTAGKEITVMRLSEIFLELQEKGANNINLVTPTHFVPLICLALKEAKLIGLKIPIVYNTSAYKKISTLNMLSGMVDIYLPDLKYKGEEMSTRYSHAPDYFAIASKAIAEMVRQVGNPILEEDTGIIKKGVIVRHLVLPGGVEDSKEILRYLYDAYGNGIYISILNQYTPLAAQLQACPELNRKITKEEYEEVVEYAIGIGVENGFVQEGETAEESFIPEFDLEGIG